MYNSLVAYGASVWQDGVYEFPRDRVATEYTQAPISERYRDLNDTTIDELKGMPTLFCVEGEEAASRVGWITSIQLRSTRVRIEFTFEDSLTKIAPGTIEQSSVLFDLGRYEMTRTHWAIKDGDLWAILERRGINCSHLRPVNRSVEPQPPGPAQAQRGDRPTVFIVHGHDDVAKYEMAEELRRLGCHPIILHEQPSAELTIIEKIERFTEVGFAVILYTPCDIGGKSQTELALKPRARQNVVFEHGYLIAKLGRDHVMAFVRGNVETPTDISGILYIDLDREGVWKQELLKELQAAEYLS